MGEKEHEPFQFTFNGFLKVEFQGSRVTSDAGLVRELDERPEHLSDSRHGLNTQFGLADLLRQSVYSRLAGSEDLNDAERLAADPAFRLIGSPKIWDRGAALTSTLHWFETELLTREENLVGLMAVNRNVLTQAERHDGADGVVLDMDSSESPVHGQQEGGAYNGHFESRCRRADHRQETQMVREERAQGGSGVRETAGSRSVRWVLSRGRPLRGAHDREDRDSSSTGVRQV